MQDIKTSFLEKLPSTIRFGKDSPCPGKTSLYHSSSGSKEDPEDPASSDASTKLDLSTLKAPKEISRLSKILGLGTSLVTSCVLISQSELDFPTIMELIKSTTPALLLNILSPSSPISLRTILLSALARILST